MRIAVIADIHGNAPALEAVLDDISRQGVDQIVQLGDAPNGPIDPVGVMNLLRAHEMNHLQGNGERMVVCEDESERSVSARFARDRLSVDQLEWIRSWPLVHRGALVSKTAVEKRGWSRAGAAVIIVVNEKQNNHPHQRGRPSTKMREPF